MGKIKYKEPVYNPRKISIKQSDKLKETLEEFGDLSGIVYNRTTGNFVGGNQRSKVMDFDSCEVEYVEKKRKPDAQGTVALGFVIWQGKRYSWREVKWDEEKEKRGNIVANKGGGEWDEDMLKIHFKKNDLLDAGFYDAELTFFDEKNIDYSERNKEINIEDLGDIMRLALSYNSSLYWEVKNKLAAIAETPEEALLKLLKIN